MDILGERQGGIFEASILAIWAKIGAMTITMSLDSFAFVAPILSLAPWFLVVIYLIPIIGTAVSLVRRVRSLWSFGGDIRKYIPNNPFSRRMKSWSQAIRAWWGQQSRNKSRHVWPVNIQLGRWEYLFGHLRDYTIGVFMTGGAIFYLTLCLLVGTESVGIYFDRAFYFGFFALLSLFTYRRHVSTGLKMTEFIRVNPTVHPQEFFNIYYQHLGPLNKPIPEHATRVVDPEDVSYLTGEKPTQGYGRLLYGFYDTAIFARSAYKALQQIGIVYGRDSFDVWAELWGSRMIQLFHSSLKLVGSEKFKDIDGKIILVFNHKSHLDFVLNFFILSQIRLKDGRRIRPRYMAAKDHFVDNKFIYSGLGVGRLIESVDMVFVDRKGRGADAITQAAHVLVDRDVSIAMYPQGTRAYGNVDWAGERRDAGFYTTGSARRLRDELGHLKKGVGFLALDTAIELGKRGSDKPVHLVFIGIEGTANLVPKGSVKIQTESEVTFTVGDSLTIYPHEVEGYEKPQKIGLVSERHRRYGEHLDALMTEINHKMVSALDLHAKLTERFLQDLRTKDLAQGEDLLTIQKKLVASDQRDELLPFKILDRIYALDPTYWPANLKRAATLFSTEATLSPSLGAFNEELVDFLLKTRGRLMKAETVAESKQQKAKKTS